MTHWKATWTRLWGANARTLGTAALAASAPALILCFIAANRTFSWGVKYGDLGVWVGGIGSALAAGAAVWTARDLLGIRKKEEQRERDEARRNAAGVQIKVKSDPKVPGWTVTLTNRSGAAILDVAWTDFKAALLPHKAPNRRIPTIGDDFPIVGIEGDLDFVPHGESRSASFVVDDPKLLGSFSAVPYVEFTDSTLFRFRYEPNFYRFFSEQNPGKWVLVDEVSRKEPGVQEE